ncbi:MAG TPA: sialidase family protein [Candidatus Thermoplasmatota archaeon]|nr:sialidase family protein [Candidatus Thermoplasmatota archaeon]
MRVIAGAATVAVLSALAGCFGAVVEPLDPAAADGRLVAHDATGVVPVPGEAADLSMALLRVGNRTGGEPTVGVTQSGALFVTGFASDARAHVYRSLDRGRSWEETARTLVGRTDLDPYLYVDVATDRVFSVPGGGVCSHVLWSDDDGRSWQESRPLGRTGGCPLLGQDPQKARVGQDHQSLAAGPPPPRVATRGYANVLYYSYNGDPHDADLAGQGGTFVSRSLDGAQSWEAAERVFQADCHGGLAGAPAAGPRGEVYLVKAGCKGVRVAVSEDGARTWREAEEIDEAGVAGGADFSLTERRPVVPNPGVAVDGAGVAYVVWPGRDGLLHLARSADRGRTWSDPVRVTPPGIGSTAFSAVVAGDAGRIAVAYLGTTASTQGWPRNESHYAPPDTKWDLYVTFSLDAAAPDPVFTTVRATPPDDPVQVGCVWQGGGQDDCRNLKDFIGIAERNGRVFVAYADGCRACGSQPDSNRADLFVAAVDAGPSLRQGIAIAPYG